MKKTLILIIHSNLEEIKKMIQVFHFRYGKLGVQVQFATNYKEAEDILAEFTPHLVFIKLEMNPLNEETFLNMLSGKDIEVIVTTQSPQVPEIDHELNLTDYILEPFESSELNDTLIRYDEKRIQRQLVKEYKHLINTIQPRQFKKFCVSTRQGQEYLNQSDMLYVEADGSYSILYLSDRKRVLSKKLKDIQEKLDPGRFVRIHNSWIVNLEYVKMYLSRDNQVLMTNGKVIPVSKRNRENLLRALENYNV